MLLAAHHQMLHQHWKGVSLMITKRISWLLPAAALLAMGLSHQAGAGNYGYTGVFARCRAACDDIAAFGGPGGASNPVASGISGAIW